MSRYARLGSLALIGWFQMEILGSDWLVPNGNSGLRLAGSKWKYWAMIGWFQMEILGSDWLIGKVEDWCLGCWNGWLFGKKSKLVTMSGGEWW